jgi:hypothetical protein
MRTTPGQRPILATLTGEPSEHYRHVGQRVGATQRRRMDAVGCEPRNNTQPSLAHLNEQYYAGQDAAWGPRCEGVCKKGM